LLLIRQEANRCTARLFYPNEELKRQSIWDDTVDRLCSVFVGDQLVEDAEEISSQVDILARACAGRELTTIDVKLLWKAFWPAVCALARLWSLLPGTQKQLLLASVTGLSEACQQRGADRSLQGRYAEARLNSRRSFGQKCNPLLDEHSELVKIVKQHSSRDVAEYALVDVGLTIDDYLDAMEMIAHDGRNPLEVPNPPARVCTALARERHRRRMTERMRSLPLPAEDAQESMNPNRLDAEVAVRIDLERAKLAVNLTEDQDKVLEAKIEGLSLQSREASKELGMESACLEAIRRSLEPNRRLGQKLGQQLRAYKRAG
jgi:hypothetical protein